MLRLPHYGVQIQVTTAVINPTQARYGIPDIVVAPTLSDWLAGQDPVLAKALAYARGAGAISIPVARIVSWPPVAYLLVRK